MRVKIEIKEYSDRYVLETEYGGFIAPKSMGREGVRVRARAWVKGLVQKTEAPIAVFEEEVDTE